MDGSAMRRVLATFSFFRDHVLLPSLPPASCHAALAGGPACGCLVDGYPDVMLIALRRRLYGSRCRWHRPLVATTTRLAADSVRTHLVTTPWRALARASSPDMQKSSSGCVVPGRPSSRRP